ncbi:MAG: prolipoprotein diacylglyceryl transferase [Bacteroidetes bacterium]|nr:prolipoprotein diacylglyceryl transferase [Bacteroidota bacterium]
MMYSNFPSWITPEIIPGFPLRWYGLMYIIAFSITFILFTYQLKRSDVSMNQDASISLFLWTILGLLVGSRIFATLIYDASGYYLTHPWMIFWPFRNGSFTGLQGMSYHGGVFGAVAGSYLYCRKKKLNYFQIADMITAGIPLGYTFGRLGNFINGELWGRVTTHPFGIVFPYAPRFSTQISWVREIADKLGIPLENTTIVNLPRHPSQLYEAAFEGVFLWLIIWFLLRNRKKFHGFILSLYLMGYGIVRFFIEYFREPDRDLGFIFAWGQESEPTALFLSPWNFSMGQLLNLLMAISGLILFFLMKNLSAKKEAVRKKLKSNGIKTRPPKKKKKRSRK